MRKPRRILRYGNTALLLEWEQRIDVAINRSVHAYRAATHELPGVLDCVPAYASLLIDTSLSPTVLDGLREYLYDLKVDAVADDRQTVHTVPVAYGAEHGPDLGYVAGHCGYGENEVIAAHTAPTYHVFQFGYKPGFAFLGLTPPALSVPRKAQPRPEVPAGSVGLAGRQTAIYPGAYPGGWQLIGRCPLLATTGPAAERFFLSWQPGDKVRFVQIDPQEYSRLLQTPERWTRS